MAKLALINGLPRMTTESSSVSIQDSSFLVVSSGASGLYEKNEADCTSGTPISIMGMSYTGDELEVYLNNTRLEDVIDYNWYGYGTKTQITFTFDLKTSDRIRCRIDRGA